MDKKTLLILLSLAILIGGLYFLTGTADMKPFFSFPGFESTSSGNATGTSQPKTGFSELLEVSVTPSE
ncbi:MAG: hypothetical protein UV73_C0006G0032 [Candidatus Gottesmanbacteria bacterium GW2011_GWA2_43_14]|uniref:Uncharacterized protein n=1 Tax=Candidatus Gottesmanbacteria bacterium GW2011_GWA2_43_14 TaxID=1618443 RepID=A0A0G1GFR9_9BACT|nr:MAG: hypothetical protein UV73_C0006G0032 [Candidatus Gottesmanbacteria bacterium GW2011_GWA2_43_14]